VRTRAHTCSRVRSRCRIPGDFAHCGADKLPQRTAAYNAGCLHCVRSQLVSRGVTHAGSAASNTVALRHRWTRHSQANCSHACALARPVANMVPRVRAGAHACSRVRSRCRIPDGFANRTAKELARPAAGSNARCLHCALPSRVARRGQRCSQDRRRPGRRSKCCDCCCCIAARAAAKPAAAMRARWARAGAHRVPHARFVPTGAHGAPQVPHSISHIRGVNKLPQRPAGYKAMRPLSARCRFVSRSGVNAAGHVGDGLAGEAP
jgi:hypothetical protein